MNFTRTTLLNPALAILTYILASTFSIFSQAKLVSLNEIVLEVVAIDIHTKVLSEVELSKIGRLTFASPTDQQQFLQLKETFLTNQSTVSSLEQKISRSQLSPADYSEAVILREKSLTEMKRLARAIEINIDIAARGFMKESSQKLYKWSDRENRGIFNALVSYGSDSATHMALKVGWPVSFTLRDPEYIETRASITGQREDNGIWNSLTLTYQKGLDIGITMSNSILENHTHFVMASCKEVVVKDTFLTFELPGTNETHLVCQLQGNQGQIRFKVVESQL